MQQLSSHRSCLFSFSRRLFGAKKTTDPAVTATGGTKTRRGIFSRKLKAADSKAEKSKEQAAVVEEKKVEEPAAEERGPVDETAKVEPVAKSAEETAEKVAGAEEVKPTEAAPVTEAKSDTVQVETVKSDEDVEAATPGESTVEAASKPDAEEGTKETIDDEARDVAEGAAIPDASTDMFCGCIDTNALKLS